MECSNLIASALKQGDISTSLFKGSKHTLLIEDLQRVLFELGFKRELKLDKYEVDGDYGPATASAVAAFSAKNNLKSDGFSVSNSLAKMMLKRHGFLTEMYLLWSIYNSDLRTKKYISKGTKTSITAIQLMLVERGYEKDLNFQKFGVDGVYGQSTRKAMIAYARGNSIDSDGDLLTRPLMNIMLNDINTFYGENWSDLAANNLPNVNSPLIFSRLPAFWVNPADQMYSLFQCSRESISMPSKRMFLFMLRAPSELPRM